MTIWQITPSRLESARHGHGSFRECVNDAFALHAEAVHLHARLMRAEARLFNQDLKGRAHRCRGIIDRAWLRVARRWQVAKALKNEYSERVLASERRARTLRRAMHRRSP